MTNSVRFKVRPVPLSEATLRLEYRASEAVPGGLLASRQCRPLRPPGGHRERSVSRRRDVLNPENCEHRALSGTLSHTPS